MPKVEVSNEAEHHARDVSAGREPTAQIVISIESNQAGRERLVLCDDRGLKVRGVLDIQVDQAHGDITIATIRVIVDRKRGAALRVERQA